MYADPPTQRGEVNRMSQQKGVISQKQENQVYFHSGSIFSTTYCVLSLMFFPPNAVLTAETYIT